MPGLQGERNGSGRGAVAVAFAALLLASLTLLAVPPARAETYVRGSIVVDTVWDLAGSPYIVPDSDFARVEPGVSLTVEPGVEVRLGRFSYLEVAGELVAVGTPDARIRFTSNVSSPTPSSYWESLRTRSQGHVAIRWVDFTYAFQPLDLWSGNNTIEDCEVSYSYRIVFAGVNNTMARCHVHDTQTFPGWSTVVIAPIMGNPTYGNTIRDSTFERNDASGGTLGIGASDRNAVANNTFKGNANRAIVVDGGQHNAIVGNTIVTDIIYFKEASNNTFAGNTVDGSTATWGMLFDGRFPNRDNLVEGNRFLNSGWAVRLLGGGTQNNTIRNNTVANNTVGVEVNRLFVELNEDWGPPVGNVVYHNRFLNNTVQAVDNTQPGGTAWDAGCPVGGNYWSDYVGGDAVDCATGLPGTDGFGDAPYAIDGDSRDDYPLLAPPDREPPEMFNATLSGETALAANLSALGPLPFRAVADDVRTGGSQIAAGNVTLGPANWPGASLDALDGTFDEANETLAATIDPPRRAGTYAYCAYAADAAGNGNETGVCASLIVVDDVPPRIRDVTLDGQTARSVVRGTPVLLEAVVDDTATGGTVIGGANVTSPRAAWSNATALLPRDALDADVEAFTRTVDTSALPVGTYDLCVYGWDSIPNGNVTGACAVLTVTSAARPDLAPGTPQPDAAVRTGLSLPTTFSVRVRNLGDATSGDATLAFYNESTPSVPFATFAVPPLGPSGDAGPFAASWTSPAAPGTYRVVADVDYGDRVAEANESNNRFTWSVEVLAGPVTRLVVGAPNHTSDATYVTSATPLAFSVLDQGGTGIRNTTYRVDGGPWGNYTATGPFALPGEGEHVVEWYSEDNAGNVEPAASAPIRVDDTPPATILAVGDPKHVTADTYVTSATPLTLAAADGGIVPVGVARIEYRIDVGGWIPHTGPITLAGEGPAVVEYRAVDHLGNEEPIRSAPFVVDDTPPTTTHVVGEPRHLGSQTFVTSATPLTLQAADGALAPVGVAATEYRVDDGPWTPYGAFFRVAGEGPHLVEYRSTDLLGNAESPQATTFVVDDAPPDVVLDVGTPRHAGAALYVTSATPFTVTADDGGAVPVGLASAEYRTGGGWTAYVGPFTVAGADGPKTVEYRAIDLLGNAFAGELDVVLDDSPPVTTPSHPDGTYPPDTGFALVPADTGSGVARTEYAVDDGPWASYVSPFSLPAGDHAVRFRSTDNVGNEEPERVLSVTIAGAPVRPPEMNWKPVVAAVFSALLGLVGGWSAMRIPPTGSRPRLRGFAVTALPFVLVEAATGVVSLFTGLLAIPPLLGAGTAVDLLIVVAGIAVSVYRVRKWMPPS